MQHSRVLAFFTLMASGLAIPLVVRQTDTCDAKIYKYCCEGGLIALKDLPDLYGVVKASGFNILLQDTTMIAYPTYCAPNACYGSGRDVCCADQLGGGWVPAKIYLGHD
ncbi:hypothetical protein LTR17_014509 [Elasticomyces elasticus]|nr:hypothetical protein LTR17_014509 [Elasticomyces elasticus]